MTAAAQPRSRPRPGFMPGEPIEAGVTATPARVMAQAMPNVRCPRRYVARARFANLALAGLLALGCVKAPDHCYGGSVCPAGHECLANRCVTIRKDAVPSSERRLILEPLRMAVADADDRIRPTVPQSVNFGGGNQRSQALLIDFAAEWRDLQVTAAFLLLDPLPGTEANPGGVPVRVSRIGRRWQAANHKPLAGLPTTDALATGIAGAALRIDVTNIVRYLQERPENSHGLIVEASDSNGLGVTYSTGLSDGRAPRLEIYGNRREMATTSPE